MNKKAIAADKIYISGKFISDHAVIMENGYINDIIALKDVASDVAVEEFSQNILIPGYFDIQVNGGGGALFNDNPSVEAIKIIGNAHRKFGTTSFLPTLISDDLAKIEAAISAVDEAIGKNVPGVVGIHIEGPFLNEQKKGIHDAGKFRQLTQKDVALLSSLKHGKTLVTLAPEMNDLGLITKLAQAGVIVSIGHSNATYEQAMDAVDAGINGFTHLYNAMSPFQSRAPGVVGAAFAAKNCWASIIADGFHVHGAALKHAIKTKGTDRMILITDAMPTVGSDKNNFWLGDEYITAKDGRCTNANGTLAGSDLDMASAVKYVVENSGCTIEEAIMMASLCPATFMKLDNELGSIAVGKKANFILLDGKLDVENVWIDGVEFS